MERKTTKLEIITMNKYQRWIAKLLRLHGCNPLRQQITVKAAKYCLKRSHGRRIIKVDGLYQTRALNICDEINMR